MVKISLTIRRGLRPGDTILADALRTNKRGLGSTTDYWRSKKDLALGAWK
jgi:hypothetical protein